MWSKHIDIVRLDCDAEQLDGDLSKAKIVNLPFELGVSVGSDDSTLIAVAVIRHDDRQRNLARGSHERQPAEGERSGIGVRGEPQERRSERPKTLWIA